MCSLRLEVRETKANPLSGFNVEETVMIPAHARRRHVVIEERLKELQAYADSSELNRVEYGQRDAGFITSGISYVWPLPIGLIKRFV
ncbi:MAG TPA: hypothetical protein GXX40_09745 [Firmicutes bacterium]|nr:hypothetical protein [Bacillota bacterium]